MLLFVLLLDKEPVMAERPFPFLAHQGPRSSGTLVFPTVDDAMEGNSSTLPGLPPQPALDTLQKKREGGEERKKKKKKMLHSFASGLLE